MIKQSFTTVVLILVSTGSLVAKQTDSTYIRIGKSMQLFGSVVREVSNSYVDPVDPVAMVEAGINGMMKYLDPYSTYMKVDETDDVDAITFGHYTGFGFTVGIKDSSLTIVDLRENCPAKLAGVRIGDQLLSIDGQRVDTVNPSNLKPYTRGATNTSAQLTFVRGKRDTLRLTMKRADIPVENITYSSVLSDQIGYVKLARFSRSTEADLSKVLSALHSNGPLNGLIIDVRDNPGGLLDAAVSVAQFFLPQRSTVVSTVARDGRLTTYKTTSEPLYPDLPLAVLINHRSASASEILAGALQDLDRAVIIGETSFGKGLVQTVHSLPVEGTVKLTSSRYVTPSGRNVQRVDYTKLRGVPLRSPWISDAKSHQEYFTHNHRPVSADKGVTPDIAVKDSVFPEIVQRLLSTGVVFNYGSIVSAEINTLPLNYSFNKKDFEGFCKYAESKLSMLPLPVLSELHAAKSQSEAVGLGSVTSKNLDALIKSSEQDVMKSIRSNASLLSYLLETEVLTRFGTESDRIKRMLSYDSPLSEAKSILVKKNYQSILTGDSDSDQ